MGSVADRGAGVAGSSTAPTAVVVGVAGAVLLLVAALVLAGFRARARLGRLG